jgi:type IV secretion system protein VirD4
MDDTFNEEHAFGSARWADAEERRPLLAGSGLYLGTDEHGRVYRHPGGGPALMIAGSGAGKGRDGGLMFNACTYPGSMLIVDVKGEIAAVSIAAQVAMEKYAFCVNPASLHGLPNHTTDPLHILEAGSPTLVYDAKLLAEMLKPLSGSNNAAYFELGTRLLFEAVMLTCVEHDGHASLPHLYTMIKAIDGNPDKWAAFSELMYQSRYEHVRSVIGELMTKLRDAPKEAGGITGEAVKALSFLDDPGMRAGLEKPDFSLSVLTERRCNVYINVPAEYVGIWGPYLRLLIGVAMLYKQRRPQAPRVVFMLDECGQLGRADFLLRAMTFGRGAGIQTQAVFQDLGQIATHYGPQGIRTFMASSEVMQFFGVGDKDTAEMLSPMLGKETLSFNAELERMAARRAMTQIMRQVMDGADPFDASVLLAEQARIATDRKTMARPLMMPDEILCLPPDRQILFVRNMRPVLAWKKPYYSFPELAGRFLPNPFHPPTDRVLIAEGGRMRWARVVTERVPERFAHYPQYQSGQWSYVAGYRPHSFNPWRL